LNFLKSPFNFTRNKSNCKIGLKDIFLSPFIIFYLMQMNRFKFHFYNLKTNFKFDFIIAIFMPLIFLILMTCMIFSEYNAFMTIMFATLLAIQVLFLIYCIIKKLSMKKAFVFILSITLLLNVTVFITFLRQTMIHAGRGSSGTFTEDSRSFFSAVTWYHEDSADYSKLLKFQAPPRNEYYYLDFSNTSSGDQLVINLNVTCNLKLSELTTSYARSNTIYQRENGFNFTRNDTTNSFTQKTHKINGVDSDVWSHVFTYTAINDNLTGTWQFLFCFAVNGVIDKNWVGNSYVSYLWIQFNATATDNGVQVEPRSTGMTYDMIPLRYAVSDTFWLISVSIGVIWLIVFLLALAIQNTQVLTMIQVILISLAICCLFVLIAMELHADWTKWVPWPLSLLTNFIAVGIASIKWLISIGAIVILTTILSVFMEKLITSMKGNMNLGMPRSSKQRSRKDPCAGIEVT